MADAGLRAATPAIGWSYQVNFGGEKRPRSLVAQMHLPIDTTAGATDELLDKIRASMDRQCAFYDLEEAIDIYEGHKTKLIELVTAVDTVDEMARAEYEKSGRKGEWSPDKLTGAQEKQKIAAEGNVRQWTAKTQEWKDRVTMLRKKVNGHASDSGADRHPGGAAG